MLPSILDRLDRLRAELAALALSGEIAVAERVAAMASALRETAGSMERHGAADAQPAPRRAPG